MRTITEISSDSFYKMHNYHQISIDFIEEAEDVLERKPNDDEEKTEIISELGALSYQISNALEVFNPEFETDISDLTDILSLIEIRTGYIECFEFKNKNQ